jgi:hypothetical protein
MKNSNHPWRRKKLMTPSKPPNRSNARLTHGGFAGVVTCCLIAVAASAGAQTASPDGVFSITARDMNSRTWTRIETTTDPVTGWATSSTQSFQELGNGICYQGILSGASQTTWLDSQDIIDVTSSGAHQSGNGTDDTPAGTVDWLAYPLLSGSGFTEQLWAAPGLSQPESSLQPASPTTTFRTSALGAGILVGVAATLPNVPGGDVATVTLRVWDNGGGTITSWTMAQAAGVALGESPLFNSQPVGAFPDQAPNLIGLVSFNR